MMQRKTSRCPAAWVRGTIKIPPDMATSRRSTTTRHPARLLKNAPAVMSSPVVLESGWDEAKNRSTVNTVMPSAPSGTKVACTSPLSRRLHSNEPMAIPTEKVVRSMVRTCTVAPRTSLVNVGNCARNVAPINQNQEMPMMQRKTSRCPAAWVRIFHVCVMKLKLIARSGCAGRVAGMYQLEIQPSAATAITTTEMMVVPRSVNATSVPRMVPARIARKVPAENRALPPMSSSSCS